MTKHGVLPDIIRCAASNAKKMRHSMRANFWVILTAIHRWDTGPKTRGMTGRPPPQALRWCKLKWIRWICSCLDSKRTWPMTLGCTDSFSIWLRKSWRDLERDGEKSPLRICERVIRRQRIATCPTKAGPSSNRRDVQTDPFKFGGKVVTPIAKVLQEGLFVLEKTIRNIQKLFFWI